jgi:hypothetical protein
MWSAMRSDTESLPSAISCHTVLATMGLVAEKKQ